MRLICASLFVSLLILSGCHTSYESWALSHGVSQWRHGNYKEAIRYLEDVLKHHPQNVDAHLRLAVAYEDVGDYEKAREYYSKAVELDSRYALFYDVGSNKIESADIRRGWREIDRSQSGMVDEKIGYDQAITSFNLALRKNPQSAEAYIGLATLWGNYKKDYDKAIEYLSKAIEIEPKAGYFFARGEMWRKKKDFDRAVKDYNKVLELTSYDGTPYAVHARKIASEAISDLQKNL